MIASFRHGFVFIKSKKAGGSAVENALAPLCGPADVITPAGFDEPMQKGGEARNFSRDPKTLALYREALADGDDPGHVRFLEIDRRCRAAGEFHTHMSAAQARARLGEEDWGKLFKFSIERHPYEKAVSQAWFSWARRGGGAEQDFDAFFDEQVRTGPYENARFYTIGGRPALDRVLRYERLDEELREVAGRLGLPLQGALPRVKSGLRGDARPAREILGDDQKEAIYKRCRYEFDFMGYEP